MASRNTPPLWISIAAGIAALCLVGGAVAFAVLWSPAPQQRTQVLDQRGTGQADIGGPFTLVDQDGAPFTDADLLGRPSLIYFGYTFCPDVCPLSLQVMEAAIERLPPGLRADIRPVFISVDPERDTPERLKQYAQTPGFPAGLVALTGTVEQVEAAKAAYRIYSARGEQAGDFYLVDHTSIIYLMDQTGTFAAAFSHTESPQTVAEGIEALS